MDSLGRLRYQAGDVLDGIGDDMGKEMMGNMAGEGGDGCSGIVVLVLLLDDAETTAGRSTESIRLDEDGLAMVDPGSAYTWAFFSKAPSSDAERARAYGACFFLFAACPLLFALPRSSAPVEPQ